MEWQWRPAVCAGKFIVPEMRRGASLLVEDEIVAGECVKGTRGYLFLNSWMGQNIHCHSPCQCNEVRAASQRVLMQVPRLDEVVVLPYLKMAQMEVISQLGCVHKATDEELLLMYPKKKRKAYHKAMLSLESEPLTKRDSMVTAFVKSEKLMIQDRDGDPRMIQFRTLRFNVSLGAYTRPAERRLYRLKDRRGFRVIMKGRNERQRAQALYAGWTTYLDPVAVCFDLSRWDAHCSDVLMKLGHQVWLHMYGYDAHLAELLHEQFNNRCHTYNGVRYKAPAGVMSGDMTTACGNCLMCTLLVWGLIHWLEEQHGKQMSLTFFNDGDDHCIIGERPDVELYSLAAEWWFRKCGHSLKIEGNTDEFNSILFCQSKPIFHHDTWEMMPNPHKVISTAFMVPGRADPDVHLSQVMHMRAIIHQGQPVLGPLFLRWSRKWRKPKEWDDMLFLSTRMQIDKRTKITMYGVEEHSREQLYVMFGLTPEEQLDMESFDFRKPLPEDYTRVNTLFQMDQGEMEVCQYVRENPKC